VTQTVFGAGYAGSYDTLYRDKDYSAECDLIERVFREHARGPVQRVLDLGCGTGGHSAILAERGFVLFGIDRSEDMLRIARARSSSARFQQGDLTNFALNETFDAALIMFAVLGYLTDNRAVQDALQAVRKHLRTGGVLFADIWYGPAVLAQRPSERVKVLDTPTGGQVIRVASSRLDTRRNVCTVEYRLWHLEQQRVVSETHEHHPMRYFFEPELESLLAAAGFDLVCVGAFPDVDEPPSEDTWNVSFVARAT
jgi:SAM-dependent methyltransferase